MSVHGQRGKVKTVPRARGQRVVVNPTNCSKGPHVINFNHSEDDPGIFGNSDLTYVLSRHVIGNIAEVITTENDKVLGLIRAISPCGDMGLGYSYTTQRSKNGQINGSSYTIPISSWKMVRISNIKLSDCLLVENKADMDVVNECDSSVSSDGKELVRFFATSDSVKDCLLDKGGFPAEEMFKTNEELFSVPTTYNPDLSEYTTPVDKSAPNYSETEARCAQLAREIEGTELERPNLDDAFDDEELAFSAVVRPSKQSIARASDKDSRASSDRPATTDGIVLKNRQMTLACDLTNKTSLDSKLIPEGSTSFTVCEVKGYSTAAISSKVVIGDATMDAVTVSQSPTVPSIETVVAPLAAVTSASSDARVKKSTLDPNAPEFQPMGVHPTFTHCTVQSQIHVQPPIHTVAFTPHVQPAVNANTSGHLAMQNLTTFVAAPPSQLYAPSSLPYGSHAAPMPHIFSSALPNQMASVAHQMRGGSLPPSLHQQNFPSTLSSGAGVLLHAQPGASMAQMINTQSSVIPGQSSNGRFTGSSLGIARQTSNDHPSTTSQPAYGPPQNMPVSALQPPIYQLSQTSTGMPLWVAGAQMGLHFVPAPASSSTLVVGNIPFQQSEQQIYPAHAMLHVQPQVPMPSVQLDSAPSTTHQSQHPPLFQAHSGAFQEHLQLPHYAQGMMFASQQPASAYYPAAPVLTGPGTLAPSVRAGLLSVLNQPTAQHPVTANVGHHQPAGLDPALLNPQLPTPSSQPNRQPPHVQFYNAAHQLFQSQQLAANAHIGSQALHPDSYQNIVALFGAINLPSQAH